MNSATQAIAVYGATGHTGRFVVNEALRRGLSVVAVGRDAARLDQMFPAAVTRRIASLGDAQSLEQAFSGCAVVINCAGPFLDTAAPVTLAALRAGCHYIDVTAEQASAMASFADFDAPARAAGRVVIPAAGFYGAWPTCWQAAWRRTAPSTTSRWQSRSITGGPQPAHAKPARATRCRVWLSGTAALHRCCRQAIQSIGPSPLPWARNPWSSCRSAKSSPWPGT